MTHPTFVPSRRNILQAVTGIAAAGLPFRSASAQQKKLDHVNIVTASGNLNSTLHELLMQQGFLEKFGIEATQIYVSDGTKLMGGVLTGQMDICPLAGFSQVFPAVERGGKLKVVNGGVLLGEQAVVSAKPEITKVEDLAGKTIGAGSPGSQLNLTMVALLQSKGVKVSSVTFANIGSSANVFRAVAQKLVDAGPCQIDVIPELSKYGLHIIKGGEMWKSIPKYPYQGGFSADTTIAAKRDVLTRTLAAYASLFRFLSGPDSHDAFLDARVKALQGTGAAFKASSEYQWKFFQSVQPFSLDLLIPEDRITYLQKLSVEAGIQSKVLPYDEVVDVSLAHAAIKLLG